LYAEDEIILEIEEAAKVLLNEMTNQKLIEDNLKTPIIDMRIDFDG
jgi:hypothetical protein